MKKYIVRNKNLLYPELSFVINGILIEVNKQLGGGHLEKYYQKAIGIGLKKSGLNFREQCYVPLQYDNQHIGKYFLDFIVENKIIIEVKQGKFVTASLIEQVKRYLKSTNLKLALIACFTYNGVAIKRIINE